jgi:hypothetical protein
MDSRVVAVRGRLDGSRLRGSAELQYMLGVSRQRISQLTTAAGFPEPLAELRTGKVWDVEDVKAWARRVGRDLRELPESWPFDVAEVGFGTSGSGRYRPRP